MGTDINRLKVVLAEKKHTNKWLTEQLGKDPSTTSAGPQLGPQLDSSRAQVGPKYEPSTSQVQVKYVPSTSQVRAKCKCLYVPCPMAICLQVK